MWLVYCLSLEVGEKIVGFVKEKLFSLVWSNIAVIL